MLLLIFTININSCYSVLRNDDFFLPKFVFSGLVFPVCSTCQNTLSSDGVDIERKLSEALNQLQSKVSKFLTKDKAAGKTIYSLKTRLIGLRILIKYFLDH